MPAASVLTAITSWPTMVYTVLLGVVLIYWVLALLGMVDFESSGIDLDIDTHAIAARPAKGEGPHRHHDFLFLAVATRPFEPTPQVEEVNGVAWLPIDDFLAIPGASMQHLAPKLRQLLAAMT